MIILSGTGNGTMVNYSTKCFICQTDDSSVNVCRCDKILTKENLTDGMIGLDTPQGNFFNFTSDRFDGYLWKKDNYIAISFIMSHKKGNFKELVNTILNHGFAVYIPTPLGRMQDIVNKNRYEYKQIFDNDMREYVDVWIFTPEMERMRNEQI